MLIYRWNSLWLSGSSLTGVLDIGLVTSCFAHGASTTISSSIAIAIIITFHTHSQTTWICLASLLPRQGGCVAIEGPQGFWDYQ
jgi:hypothetical protein